MAAAEFDLEVFFVLFDVGRWDLHVLKLDEIVKSILWHPFWLTKLNAIFGEELPSEQIAVDDSDDVLVEVHITADVEVFPSIPVITA